MGFVGINIDDLLGLRERPNPKQLLEHANMEIEILRRLWPNVGDKDCDAVRGFADAMEAWYSYMAKTGDAAVVTKNVHEAIAPWMEGYSKTIDEFNKLGRLRCDAIEAATGTNPFPASEESAMREALYEKHEQRGDRPHPSDEGWVKAADRAG